jgi:hypothetical protein
MSFHVPENQTVCWTVYKQAVAQESGLTGEFLAKEHARIARAFEYGEPVWSIVLELKLVDELSGMMKPEKTPLQLARRVVRL